MLSLSWTPLHSLSLSALLLLFPRATPDAVPHLLHCQVDAIKRVRALVCGGAATFEGFLAMLREMQVCSPLDRSRADADGVLRPLRQAVVDIGNACAEGGGVSSLTASPPHPAPFVSWSLQVCSAHLTPCVSSWQDALVLGIKDLRSQVSREMCVTLSQVCPCGVARTSARLLPFLPPSCGPPLSSTLVVARSLLLLP